MSVIVTDAPSPTTVVVAGTVNSTHSASLHAPYQFVVLNAEVGMDTTLAPPAVIVKLPAPLSSSNSFSHEHISICTPVILAPAHPVNVKMFVCPASTQFTYSSEAKVAPAPLGAVPDTV